MAPRNPNVNSRTGKPWEVSYGGRVYKGKLPKTEAQEAKARAIKGLFPNGAPDDVYRKNGLPVPKRVRAADDFDPDLPDRRTWGHIKDSYTDHAFLSKSAYTFGKNVDSIPEAYQLDLELSNNNRAVFYDGVRKKAVIAYRGTIPTNLADLAIDATIAVGAQNSTRRFKDAKAVAEQAIAKYGRENVTLTGHSLGGSQALAVGQALDLETHAFNPGKGFDGRALVRGNPDIRNRKTTSTVYTTGVDPISALARFGNEKQVHVSADFSLNPLSYHDLDNFTAGRDVGPYA